MRVDTHQHFWTQPLLEALAARAVLPHVRRSDGVTMLHCAGELPYVIDVPAETPGRRAHLLQADGVDLALIALSSVLGIEALERESAAALIEAHLDGVEALSEEFAPWGPVALDQPDPDDIDGLLARGCVGVSVPAGALAGPEAFDAVRPLLERSAARGLPVFVHPGPAPGQRPPEISLTEPLWWRAMTGYLAQMQQAWLTFATHGRREHPGLVVVFAMLAGGAPLHAERLAARGGPPVELRDPSVFYDTSSYGASAIEAMARVVGAPQLVYGSDRPVVEPARTGWEASLQANAAGLVAPVRSAA